jgi:hypothetical protein
MLQAQPVSQTVSPRQTAQTVSPEPVSHTNAAPKKRMQHTLNVAPDAAGVYSLAHVVGWSSKHTPKSDCNYRWGSLMLQLLCASFRSSRQVGQSNSTTVETGV